jgi:hypothetical protein
VWWSSLHSSVLHSLCLNYKREYLRSISNIENKTMTFDYNNITTNHHLFQWQNQFLFIGTTFVA